MQTSWGSAYICPKFIFHSYQDVSNRVVPKYVQALLLIHIFIFMCIYQFIDILATHKQKIFLSYHSSTIEFLHNGMKCPALFVQPR